MKSVESALCRPLIQLVYCEFIWFLLRVCVCVVSWLHFIVSYRSSICGWLLHGAFSPALLCCAVANLFINRCIVAIFCWGEVAETINLPAKLLVPLANVLIMDDLPKPPPNLMARIDAILVERQSGGGRSDGKQLSWC